MLTNGMRITTGGGAGGVSVCQIEAAIIIRTTMRKMSLEGQTKFTFRLHRKRID